MQDKVIVITGASAGIGAALAAEVVRRGARVVLAARRQAELDAVAAPFGDRAIAVATDVSSRADTERLRDAALAAFGQIDVWVANAGRGISRPVSQLTDDDIDDMVTTNIKSVVYGIQAVLPHMKARGTGHLVTVSSMLARLPLAPIRSIYGASKAAVNLLMGNLRGELRSEFPGIHATTVMPGVVATGFGQNSRHGGPDSRALPGAQPVEEVAVAIADVIATPRAEIYTRPGMQDLVARYMAAADVGTIEGVPPFAIPLPPVKA